MRNVVVILIVVFPALSRAQYNSDYKTVAKKKIKTVTRYTVDSGDTLFYKYHYDRQGRLLKEEQYQWSEIYRSDSYDINGNHTQRLELLPRVNMDTVYAYNDWNAARRYIRYDTVEFYWYKYDLISDRITESLIATYPVNYTGLYENWDGSRIHVTSTETRGDTVFFYEDSSMTGKVLWDFHVAKWISKRHEATTWYKVKGGDTLFWFCEIREYNRHGDQVSHDFVRTSARDSAVHLRDNQLYSPIDHPGYQLTPYWSCDFEYRLNGSLKKSICRHALDSAVTSSNYPRSRPSYATLEEFISWGTIVYEYYE